MHLDEKEWISQLKAGNEQAFRLLLETYRDRVINICFRFLLSREEAEDAAQEAFIEIYQSVKNFRGDAKLSTWIHRVAVSKSLDELKRRKRKKRISSLGKIIGLENVIGWAAGKERPDKTLEDNEDHLLLMHALDKLPDNQRIALTLSKLEGCSTDDIAELMSMSRTAVDSVIYRAKKQLKEILERTATEK